MGKLVVLRVRDGDFEKGFNVTLEIGEDGAPPSTVMEGTRCLPAAPYIPEQYSHWKSNYFELNGTAELSFRVKAGGGTGTPGTSSEIQKREEEKLFETFEKLKAECRKSAQKVESSINSWLNSNAFRPMEQKLRTELNTFEEVRVIIQTADNKIQKLPWHVWDFFEAFPNAEAALGSLEYKRVKRSAPATLKDQVKILAILGNSEGINVEKDREFLESLPNAKTLFLVEPKRKEFDKLWDESWDILFFAGHSSSKIDGQTGQIQINPNDELAIEQLENTLSQAIRNGLQLAIFNSCDGLGLARGLAGLHIPQTIVMRESVPDRVAQEFLKYFLKAFSSGSSLYSSVRQARKKLQELDDLEEEFPGATWFPVIYQNPAEVPLNWKDLHSHTNWEQNYKHGLEWFLKKLDELFDRNVISAKWSSYFSLRNLLICFGISLAYIIILTLLSYVLAGENPIFKAENISTPARILVGIVSLLILTSMEVSNRKAYFDATAGKFGFYQNHYSFIETFQQNFIVTDNLDKTDAKLDSLILSFIDKQTFFSKKKWNKVAFARWLVRGIGGVIFGFAQYCLTGDWLNTISVLIVAFLFGFAYAAGATFSFGIVSLFGSKFKSIGVYANFFWNIYSPLALIAVLGLIFMAKKIKFGFSGLFAGTFILANMFGIAAGFFTSSSAYLTLYVVGFPLIVGFFNWLSWGSSRVFLKYLLNWLGKDDEQLLGFMDKPRHWSGLFMLALLDVPLSLIFSCGIIVTLISATYCLNITYLIPHGLSPLPITEVINGIMTTPLRAKYFGITFMFLSPFLVTFIHVVIVLRAIAMEMLSFMQQLSKPLNQSFR